MDPYRFEFHGLRAVQSPRAPAASDPTLPLFVEAWNHIARCALEDERGRRDLPWGHGVFVYMGHAYIGRATELSAVFDVFAEATLDVRQEWCSTRPARVRGSLCGFVKRRRLQRVDAIDSD